MLALLGGSSDRHTGGSGSGHIRQIVLFYLKLWLLGAGSGSEECRWLRISWDPVGSGLVVVSYCRLSPQNYKMLINITITDNVKLYMKAYIKLFVTPFQTHTCKWFSSTGINKVFVVPQDPKMTNHEN